MSILTFKEDITFHKSCLFLLEIIKYYNTGKIRYADELGKPKSKIYPD
jgi:hypothetical protein